MSAYGDIDQRGFKPLEGWVANPLGAKETEVAWRALALTRSGQAGDGVVELATLAHLRPGASAALVGVIDISEVVLLRHAGATAQDLLTVLSGVVDAGTTAGWTALKLTGQALIALVYAEHGPVDAAVAAHARTRAGLGSTPDDLLSKRLHLLTLDCLGISAAIFGLDEDLRRFGDIAADLEQELGAVASGDMATLGTAHSTISRTMHGLEVALAPLALGGQQRDEMLDRVGRGLESLNDVELVGGPAVLVDSLRLILAAYTGAHQSALPKLLATEPWLRLRWNTARYLSVAALLHSLNEEAVPDLSAVARARDAHHAIQSTTSIYQGTVGMVGASGAYLLAGAERLRLEQLMLGHGYPNEVELVAMRQLKDVSNQLRITQTALHSAVSAQETAESLRHHNAQLRQANLTDPLTGVGNRRHLEQTMSRFAQGNAQVGVLVLDIDRFKQVNDTVGHLVADQVLSRVASLIAGCVRSGDEVFRYGGDEFVVLLPGASAEICALRAAELREAIADANWAKLDARLSVTVTVGFAADTEVAAVLLDRADQHLLAGKHNRIDLDAAAQVTPGQASR